MQHTAGVANFPDKGGLDIHMNIFKFRVEPEPALFYLPVNIFQASDNTVSVPFRNNTLFRQHLCMSNTAFDIVFPEPLIKRYRLCIVLYAFGSFSSEPSSPGFFHGLLVLFSLQFLALSYDLLSNMRGRFLIMGEFHRIKPPS